MRPAVLARRALLLLAGLAAAAGACLVPAAARAEEPAAVPSSSGNVNAFAGQKFLDSDHWDPVDDQAQGGVLVDFRFWRLPLNVAVDLLYSRDEEDVDVEVLNVGTVATEVEGETLELDLGVRAIWERPRFFRPFLGGGFAVIRAEIEASALGNSTRDTDTALGVWLDAGAYVTLARRWNVGIDGRWSWAQAELLGESGDVGGWHIGALAGVHW